MVYRLFVERAGDRLAFDGWADRSSMALQVETDPGQVVDVVAGELALLPSSLAGAVGLGPRLEPTTGQAVVTRPELRDAVVAGSPVDGLGAVATVWTLRWVEGTTPGEGLTVVDGGPGGSMWIAAGIEGDEMLLRDEGSLAVWVRLGALLSLPGAPLGSAPGEADLDDPVVTAE